MTNVAQTPALAVRRAALQACDRLERAARWSACATETAVAAGSSAAEIATRLRLRLTRVHELLAPLWPALGTAIEAGDWPSPGASDEAERVLRAAAAQLGQLERSLRKLPGAPVRSETYGLLAELAERVPPVVLVPEDTGLDEDGFLALAPARVLAPLSWPRLAFGLAASASGTGSVQWDLQAAYWLGPAYLFALVELASGLAELPAELGGRIVAVRQDLERRGLLVPELDQAAGSLGALPAPPAPGGGDRQGPAFDAENLAAAEAVAARLADGILASARSTADRAAIRAARDRLLGDPDGGPEAVYLALEGLREQPLAGAEILAGGWLHYARSRLGWLGRALAAREPFGAYGREILGLDALLLKSLETASVHRRLVT